MTTAATFSAGLVYPLDALFTDYLTSTDLRFVDASGRQFLFSDTARATEEGLRLFADDTKRDRVGSVRGSGSSGLGAAAGDHAFEIEGESVGGVRIAERLWWSRATYAVYDGRYETEATIFETNPWLGAVDGFLRWIPGGEWMLLPLIRPTYVLVRADGRPILSMRRRLSVLARQFRISRLADASPEEERRALIALVFVMIRLRW